MASGLHVGLLALLMCILSSIASAQEPIALSGNYGILTSPNFPHQYSVNTEITWNITVATGRRIRLTFPDFDLEDSWECESDVVTVSANGEELHSFCGDSRAGNEHAPPTDGVVSTGNNITVTFYTDHSDLYRYTGFRAIFVAEDINECETENGGCVQYCHNYIGGSYCSCREYYTLHEDGESCVAQCSSNVLNKLSDVIKTPEYPHAYPGYSDCDWTISVAEGYVIEFMFDDFEVEDHPDGGCPYDSLMMEVDGQTLGPYCGTEANDWPETITTSGNELQLRFHSDKELGLRGFKATYRAIPKACEEIEAPLYGTLSLQELVFGQIAIFGCSAGYDIVGSSERACLADGTWSGVAPYCLAIDCGEPASISNGEFVGTHNNYTFTQSITYQCNALYQLVGEDSRTCQSDGTWSGNQPYCVPICGRSKVPPREEQRSRIVGGQEANPGSWPWMVYLRINAPSFGLNENSCGGSLLNEYWVVTAAHCVTGTDDGLKSRGLYGATIPPHTLTAYLGVHNKDERDSQSHIIERTFDGVILRHSDYDVALYDADIALLHLSQPVTLTDRIRPICLPSLDEEDSVSEADQNDEVGIIMGWGRIHGFGITSATLQEAYVPLVDNARCQAANTYTVTDHMICAGFETGGRDACQGDSGGPMVLPEEFGSSTYMLKGIISWGEGCARSGKYGVYTRVENFVDWIETNTHIDRY